MSTADVLVPRISELERLRDWQRQVADALGVSEGPGAESGGQWVCADAGRAARCAAEARAAVRAADELAEKVEGYRDRLAEAEIRVSELTGDLGEQRAEANEWWRRALDAEAKVQRLETACKT